MRLQKEQCPSCAAEGKDTRRDNLIIYPDGHKHCFACGYHTQANTRNKLMNLNVIPASQLFIQLPEDFTFSIPDLPKAWLHKYLDDETIRVQNIGWSDERNMVIFPYFGYDTSLLAWQGRYFGDDPKHPKWFSKGNLQDTLYIVGDQDKFSRSIVLVEDIISAIKVAPNMACMPVFGSFVSMKLLTRLQKMGYNNIIIWLDPDKRKEAIKFALQAQTIGLKSKTIFTDVDPKECSKKEITDKLLAL